jgi:undecaprenyl-phosphate 4-deoxy-4-formamido-L-arabinose transferase
MPGSRISIVVPVFNEEENLPELVERLGRVADALERPVEILLVNDGSRDGSMRTLAAAARRDPRLTILDLNRNYGQHAAVFAGFEAARGDIIVTLDADLQNPPEEIPRLVEAIEQGYDVVGSVRVMRRDSLFRRTVSKIVNRATARVTGVALSDYGCMLRAYRAEVVRRLCASQEISTFIPVLADLFAGRVTEIPVAHDPRRRGRSKYSLLRLFRLHFDLVTSFSVLPLRALMVVGLVTSLLAFLAAAGLVAGRIVRGPEWAVSGVFTLFAAEFLFLGIVLFAIGLLGEYVGRIYLQVRRRPRYVIRQTIGGVRDPRAVPGLHAIRPVESEFGGEIR